MYVTAKEVAEYLGVTDKTVYKWAREGIIPCRRFGRTVKFSIEDIVRKEKENGVEVRHEPFSIDS